eukprot:CAMPEP_0119103192 /NCGR_PEP_ID=MMETSP1180-20130426/1697_1 /TAXON_ID=3052 ORGANISM="Chlamydomonas cf sp, Strain CCMP681" /NCGR_SAMPLE_ID=MMETSP1180 /ASSEMBLY_ACC=CAM_ASM_000741 /LENGTH=211 /DNA_ID=CAMNT_0007087637 /DNA_START=12 /DNA_END=647 /DNA_ORIENTATION=+
MLTCSTPNLAVNRQCRSPTCTSSMQIRWDTRLHALPTQRAEPLADTEAANNAGTGSLALFERALEGKSFMCTECGKCCSGKGEVWINDEEAQALSSGLGFISVEAFRKECCKPYDKHEGWWLLKNRPGTETCIFLDGKLCSVHNTRPSQCRTYPWWPELMEKTSWDQEKAQICEGFDHPDAPPLDVHSAALQLKQATRDTQLQMLSVKDKT